MHQRGEARRQAAAARAACGRPARSNRPGSPPIAGPRGRAAAPAGSRSPAPTPPAGPAAGPGCQCRLIVPLRFGFHPVPSGRARRIRGSSQPLAAPLASAAHSGGVHAHAPLCRQPDDAVHRRAVPRPLRARRALPASMRSSSCSRTRFSPGDPARLEGNGLALVLHNLPAGDWRRANAASPAIPTGSTNSAKAWRRRSTTRGARLPQVNCLAGKAPAASRGSCARPRRQPAPAAARARAAPASGC